jgi:hypothetical protein
VLIARLNYAKKYRTAMRNEEFTSLVLYLNGICQNELYHERGFKDREADEERFSICLDSLHYLFRNSLTDKKNARDLMIKYCSDLNEYLTKVAATLNSGSNVIMIGGNISHFVDLSPELIKFAKKSLKDVKTTVLASHYLMLLRHSKEGASKQEYTQLVQTFLKNSIKLGDFIKQYHLCSFLETVNKVDAVPEVNQSIKDLLRKISPAAELMKRETLTALVESFHKFEQKIPADILGLFESKTASAMARMDRDDFYSYFLTARFTKDCSEVVLRGYLDRKRKDRKLELKEKQLETVHEIIKTLEVKAGSVLEELRIELENDLQVLKDVQMED